LLAYDRRSLTLGLRTVWITTVLENISVFQLEDISVLCRRTFPASLGGHSRPL
jgi:hypothetical protein